MSVIKP